MPKYIEIPLASVRVLARNSLSLDLKEFEKAYLYITEKYKDKINQLPDNLKKIREGNFYDAYGKKCLYHNKRYCAIKYFFKAGMLKKDVMLFAIALISLFSPKLLLSIYHQFVTEDAGRVSNFEQENLSKANKC